LLQATGMPDADGCGRVEESDVVAAGGTDWGAIEARGFRLRIPGIEGVPARVYSRSSCCSA
jgi:hypothetical protein